MTEAVTLLDVRGDGERTQLLLFPATDATLLYTTRESH